MQDQIGRDGNPTQVTTASAVAAGDVSRHRSDADPVVVRAGRMVRLPAGGHIVPLVRLQLGVGLILLNLADFALTKAILHAGGSESNPVMRNLMPGVLAPVGIKSVLPLLAAVLLLACPATSRLADRAVATVVGIYLAIVMWNAAVLTYLMV